MPPASAPTAASALPHPSGDKRFALLEVAMKRHHYRHDALIEVLHAAQNHFGFLDHDLLFFIARRMKLPPSRVYAVATFYHFFTLKPAGRHTCVVCTGTACFVKGADRLLAAVEGAAHVGPGETTPGNELSLLTTRCLGTCGMAPVIVADGTVQGPVAPEQLTARVKGWLASGTERPA